MHARAQRRKKIMNSMLALKIHEECIFQRMVETPDQQILQYNIPLKSSDSNIFYAKGTTK